MKVINSKRDYQGLFKDFYELYKKRPIKENIGGMKLPQMFALYCFLKEIKPKFVIESGVWKGQGTWLIENSCDAKMLCIDLDLSKIVYRSPKAEYSSIDFKYQNLSSFPKDSTLLFFDDHCHAYSRFMEGIAWKFKYFIFEDNFPKKIGDTPSFKQFMEGEFDAKGPSRLPLYLQKKNSFSYMKKFLRKIFGIKPFLNYLRYDPKILKEIIDNLDIEYEEFPPIKTFEKTMWKTDWKETFGNIKPCINLNELSKEQTEIVEKEGLNYISMCLIKYSE